MKCISMPVRKFPDGSYQPEELMAQVLQYGEIGIFRNPSTGKPDARVGDGKHTLWNLPPMASR